MASVQQQEGYFRDLVERLVYQFEGRAHYDDEVAIIREAREALAKTENVSTSGGHDDGVTVGNMAKIREALIAAKGIFDSIGVNALAGELNLDAVTMICASMSAKIDAAINTPALNCDVYKTEKDTRKAFYNCYFGPTEDEFVNAAFIDWLLAPTEGGAK